MDRHWGEYPIREETKRLGLRSEIREDVLIWMYEKNLHAKIPPDVVDAITDARLTEHG